MRFLLFFCLTLIGCLFRPEEIEVVPTIPKYSGVSLVAARTELETRHLESLKRINPDFCAIIPFALGEWGQPELRFDHPRQWAGETIEGVATAIDRVKASGRGVMLKPQVWFWGGHYTGHLDMETQSDWELLEQSYEQYILSFAELAESKQVRIFCIGTEMTNWVEKRPAYWSRLINRVKSLYSGKITYAANWDSYGRIPFWDELDLIGVDAYFPLSEEKHASLEQIRNGWQPWKEAMRKLAQKHDKKLMFTEYGYRSTTYNVKEPWSEGVSQEVDLQNQERAYRALYLEFWNEDWFAGGFLWKWYQNDFERGGEKDPNFTPQHKPVEALIKEVHSQ